MYVTVRISSDTFLSITEQSPPLKRERERERNDCDNGPQIVKILLTSGV